MDVAVLRRDGRELTEQQIRQIVRSTRTELSEGEGAFRILGPDMSYHLADPRLGELLGRFEAGMSIARIGEYRTTRRLFDLCFEDSWTGFFAAAALQNVDQDDDVVVIHLDDHTDMMSTLLQIDGDALIDPASGAAFCPEIPADWEGSIRSGCIGIGSFVTALFYLDRDVHVRHLNNLKTSTHEPCDVLPEACAYPLIPSRKFAAIRKAKEGSSGRLGTYLGGSDASLVLQSTPSGHIIVHIDLDYFINDFNGNVGSQPSASVADQRCEAQRKIEHFFEVLSETVLRVERWIIATSPGFCSVSHWGWLLTSLEEKISEFELSRLRLRHK